MHHAGNPPNIVQFRDPINDFGACPYIPNAYFKLTYKIHRYFGTTHSTKFQ